MSRKTTVAGSIVILVVLILAVTLIVGKFGERGPSVISRPWVNTPYRDLPDSTLMAKAEQHDTLAAMVLSWHYMDNEDSAKAAKFLARFNTVPETASADLNYLSARAYMSTGQDTLAIRCLLPITDNKAYLNAPIYLANIYMKLKNYEQALNTFSQIDDKYLEGKDDSILVCKGWMGDTTSAMKFALNALDKNIAYEALPFFTKYVSLSRGVSPPLWSYAAGRAYLQGNNLTRAAVFMENADADTSFADLSYNLGITYFRLDVYDSAASKFEQAIEMGDTSVNLLIALIRSYNGDSLPDKEYEASKFAITVHPEVDEFYFAPARRYYHEDQYDSLLALTIEGRKHVNNSYKIDTYYAAANYLLGNEDMADAFIDTMIMKHKFQAGALTEASDLFETSLGRKDIAQRLRDNDPANKFPETKYFLYWYDLDKSRGNLDSCHLMLKRWIENDTVPDRRQLMVDLYKRDFPDSSVQ